MNPKKVTLSDSEYEEISKEKSYFAKARERFKNEYGSCPILVADWRLKKGAQ